MIVSLEVKSSVMYQVLYLLPSGYLVVQARGKPSLRQTMSPFVVSAPSRIPTEVIMHPIIDCLASEMFLYPAVA